MKATQAKAVPVQLDLFEKPCVMCQKVSIGYGNVRNGNVCSRECSDAYDKLPYKPFGRKWCSAIAHTAISRLLPMNCPTLKCSGTTTETFTFSTVTAPLKEDANVKGSISPTTLKGDVVKTKQRVSRCAYCHEEIHPLVLGEAIKIAVDGILLTMHPPCVRAWAETERRHDKCTSGTGRRLDSG